MNMLLDPEILQELKSHVESEVRRFRKLYDIPNVPFHSYRILERMVHYRYIDIHIYMSDRLSKNFDAMAMHFPEMKDYLIVMRASDREQESLNFRRRRTNFTLAHEIAHIFLGHLLQPVWKKTWMTLYWEEMEANWFAAELLMPRNVIGYFRSVQEAADALNVSPAAMRKRMQETDLLYAIRTCPECGFRKIPPAAEYCRKCGHRVFMKFNPRTKAEEILFQKNQLQEVFYEPPLVEKCLECGFSLGDDSFYKHCPHCGVSRRNFCSREFNQEPHICPPDASYCEICGAFTTYSDYLE